MNSWQLVLVLLAAVALEVAVGVETSVNPEEKYTTKYDNVDVDEIIASERLVNNYMKCALDKGKCTPDGKETKRRLKDALMTQCRKCSDKQKEAADTWAHFLYYKRRADYDAIAEKYDPGRVYRDMYEPKYLRPLDKAFPKKN